MTTMNVECEVCGADTGENESGGGGAGGVDRFTETVEDIQFRQGDVVIAFAGNNSSEVEGAGWEGCDGLIALFADGRNYVQVGCKSYWNISKAMGEALLQASETWLARQTPGCVAAITGLLQLLPERAPFITDVPDEDVCYRCNGKAICESCGEPCGHER